VHALYISPKGLCDVSRDLLKFWEEVIISRQLYMAETQLQWDTNRKSYVAYRMALLPMLLNDHDGHFCCLKPF